MSERETNKWQRAFAAAAGEDSMASAPRKDAARWVVSAAADGNASIESSSTAADADDIGLSIDMLDADRLRQYAQNLLTYSPDITHWASLPHVVSKLQTLATGIEKAVRDIGILRQRSSRSPALEARLDAIAREALDLLHIRVNTPQGGEDGADALAIIRRALDAAREAK